MRNLLFPNFLQQVSCCKTSSLIFCNQTFVAKVANTPPAISNFLYKILVAKIATTSPAASRTGTVVVRCRRSATTPLLQKLVPKVMCARRPPPWLLPLVFCSSYDDGGEAALYCGGRIESQLRWWAATQRSVVVLGEKIEWSLHREEEGQGRTCG